jgi:glycosyltransferase involved in cell wall biosynthesis
MKISVITVCYNAAAVIDKCLQSVAEQTHDDIEHIVIDGLSSDGTVDVVRRYPHVATLVSEPDHGIYDAMNKGLDHVTGDFVLFLNADDQFASARSLTNSVKAIGRNPGGDVYYGALEVRTLDGMATVFRPPRPAEAAGLMICGCLPHQSTLARPAVFAKTGRFDLRYRYHADYDWFLKILGDPMIDVRSVDEVIGSFREGGASSQLAAGQPEVYAIQNSAPLYATPEWDRKRIVVLQEAFLRERIEADRLRGEMRDLREAACGARRAAIPPAPPSRVSITAGWRSATDTAGLSLGRIRDAVLLWTRHLRWRMLEACVRYLPRGAVDGLRRLRVLGRRGPAAASAGANRPLRDRMPYRDRTR